MSKRQNRADFLPEVRTTRAKRRLASSRPIDQPEFRRRNESPAIIKKCKTNAGKITSTRSVTFSIAASRTMTTPQQRNLISSAGFIGLVAAMKEPAETYVKCNQVRLRASRSRSRTSIAYVTPPNSFRDHAMLTRTPNPLSQPAGSAARPRRVGRHRRAVRSDPRSIHG